MPTLLTLDDLRTLARSLGGGRHGEVYALEGQVYKVYRERGHRALEQAHMLRAGLGDWVLGSLELAGREVLLMREFVGRPVGPAELPAALEPLAAFLERMYALNPGPKRVDLVSVARRLERFRSLHDPRLAPLFHEVETALAGGLLDVPTAFCHLDLWADNVLVSDGGPVLVIDWVRAGWDDPLRDLALFKTGTLDLLGASESLAALERYLHTPPERRRLRAYLALTYLHDLYWLEHNEPEKLPEQGPFKLERALEALEAL